MGAIRQLPKELVEKIAAGEVVERPASVVKELVENSVDAGASSITVDCADGGKKRITVADDGEGIGFEDLAAAVLPHATSKILDETDLWQIKTLGFRGEALWSIGAVARLVIESKPNRPEVVEGAKVEMNGGVLQGPVVAGSAGGTLVTVSDLFFNVPARLKFLRSAAVEFGHIYDTIVNLALAFPDIRFELAADGRRRFVSQAGTLRDRVISVIGNDFLDRLLPVEENAGEISIRGFVAEGGRSGARDVFTFLNGRPVRDKIIMHAITAAFGERLSRGEYPAASIWIEIDPAKVDVNVHPQKREVRFLNSGAVHDFVMSAVKKALERPSLVTRDSWPVTRVSCFTSHESRVTSHGSRVFESRATSHGFHPLGQLGLTYIVCEDSEGSLVLIDQHAAHERLKFDALKRQYSGGDVRAQKLLIPETVELGEKGAAYVAEAIPILEKAGFEIEPFGGGTIVVKAVPEIIGGASAKTVFEKMADELMNFESAQSVEEKIEKIFAVIACHSQVRSGDKLSNYEIAALVRDVEREKIQTCPHGRPAIWRIGRDEIEKWFRRR